LRLVLILHNELLEKYIFKNKVLHKFIQVGMCTKTPFSQQRTVHHHRHGASHAWSEPDLPYDTLARDAIFFANKKLDFREKQK